MIVDDVMWTGPHGLGNTLHRKDITLFRKGGFDLVSAEERALHGKLLWLIGHRTRNESVLFEDNEIAIELPPSAETLAALGLARGHHVLGCNPAAFGGRGVIVPVFFRFAPGTRDGEVVVFVATAAFERGQMLDGPGLARSDFAGATVTAPLMRLKYPGPLLRRERFSRLVNESVYSSCPAWWTRCLLLSAHDQAALRSHSSNVSPVSMLRIWQIRISTD
ncbi:MAG: hypothetical protein ACR2PG_06380 [Hyphomicrobiaceae bacterium]